MRFRHMTAGMMALALSTSPVLAQGAASPARAAAPVAEANELGGGNAMVAIIGAIAWGLFIFLVIDDDDNSDSP